jgi:hypothetical protein
MMSESVTSVSLPSRVAKFDEGKSKISLRSSIEVKLSLLLVSLAVLSSTSVSHFFFLEIS